MANRKSTKVKDLKPRGLKSGSREAVSVKGGDREVTKPPTGSTHSDLSFTKLVDKSSPTL